MIISSLDSIIVQTPNKTLEKWRFRGLIQLCRQNIHLWEKIQNIWFRLLPQFFILLIWLKYVLILDKEERKNNTNAINKFPQFWLNLSSHQGPIMIFWLPPRRLEHTAQNNLYSCVDNVQRKCVPQFSSIMKMYCNKCMTFSIIKTKIKPNFVKSFHKCQL